MNHNSPDSANLQAVPAASRSHKANELELSLLAVLLLSSVYIAYEILAEPRGSHPFGHILGIIGAILMVMTEVIYSLRKRTRLLNWAGPVRYWLSLHIFTGIVGPFMVLMHTGLQFRGLAGISMLLTILVVASGFVGRYLYTALPRTLLGVVASQQEIAAEARSIRLALAQFEAREATQMRRLAAGLRLHRESRNPVLAIFGRSYYQWLYRRRIRKEVARVERLKQEQQQQLFTLLSRQRELERQVEMLESARRFMRFWHILHIPMGLTLFFSVAIHIAATVYFRAGLLK
jgi:signal transduction histidine kinase